MVNEDGALTTPERWELKRLYLNPLDWYIVGKASLERLRALSSLRKRGFLKYMKEIEALVITEEGQEYVGKHIPSVAEELDAYLKSREP